MSFLLPIVNDAVASPWLLYVAVLCCTYATSRALFWLARLQSMAAVFVGLAIGCAAHSRPSVVTTLSTPVNLGQPVPLVVLVLCDLPRCAHGAMWCHYTPVQPQACTSWELKPLEGWGQKGRGTM